MLTNKAICNILQHLSPRKITTSPYCFTNQAPCSHQPFFLLPLDAPLFLNTLSNLVSKLPGLNGPGSSMRWTGLLPGGSWGEERSRSYTNATFNLFHLFFLQLLVIKQTRYHYLLSPRPCKPRKKENKVNK